MDSELVKIRRRLTKANILFESGLNEDLAVTAVWGSQQIGFVPSPKYDGVFAIWYGKGPGVDRSADAIKHANMAGTHPNGGVLLAFGDDHPGKSSSTAHQSDLALAAHDVPILYPSDISDVISFGTAGLAMSRYSGLMVGLKFVNETADCTQAIDLDCASLTTVLPADFGPADADVGIRTEFFAVQAQDQRIVRKKLPRAKAFARANRLDRLAFGSERPKLLGIVTAGKPYQDVLEAFRLLGINDAMAATLGIGVLKVGLIYPLDEVTLAEFGSETAELLFVEEKRAHMQPQAAAALYILIGGRRSPARPMRKARFCCVRTSHSMHSVLPKRSALGSWRGSPRRISQTTIP